MTELAGAAPIHALLRAYTERNSIRASAFRSDGSLSLMVDGELRVVLQPLPDGRIMLLSSLMDMAALGRTGIGEYLSRLLRLAAGVIREHAAGLAIDSAQDRLVLQQFLPVGADVKRLEGDLADFLNVLTLWRGLCADEARGLRA